METPWLNNTEETYYAPLLENLRADVCVIGGGITGITTAYLLQEAGRRVIVVEAQKLARGVTGHTSGHVTSLVDAYYHKVISSYSTQKAKQLWEATQEARNTLEKLIADNALLAGYERTSAYYYATNEEQLKSLKRERAALEKIGVQTEEIELDEIPFKCEGAFKIADQAVINATAFTKGLAKAFVEKGGHFYEQSRVTKFYKQDQDEYVRLEMESGALIEVRDVVQATHTPLNINHVQMELKNHNSYVLAGESAKETSKGLFYDFDTPYHYTRHYMEEGRPMFVVGGFDTKTGEPESQQGSLDSLLAYAAKELSIKKVKYSWSSILFTSPDGLPLIGQDPENEKCYMATGFAGDGLTYSVVSALVNTALITEGNHKWQELFDPARITSSTIKTVVKKGVKTLKHLLVDKLTVTNDNLKDMKPQSGRVVKKDGNKVAVYRDENRKLHGVSALCTHMGCVLHFNDVATSWDCGCHGSRFSIEGKVLAGPATESLAKIEVEIEDGN